MVKGCNHLVIAAWMVALFFAVNIGASGTAASMGAAYGAGAVRRRSMALAIVSVASFLGAAFAGATVVKTIGEGIIPAHDTTIVVAVIILASACITLFLANVIGIPLSTSEVAVGAIVGVGLAIGHVYAAKIVIIASVWLVMPFLAMFIGFLFGKWVRKFEHRLSTRFKYGARTARLLTVLLILTGAYEAFSAGTNNVANAVGPLIAAGIVSIHSGLYIGALFVSLGAFFMGGRVLDTNAKRITKLSLLQGSAVSFTSGTLVVIASLCGLPVPQTQATTMAIFGIGQSHVGRDIWKQDIVKRILRIWLASPLSSLLLSYLMVEGFMYHHWTILFIVFAAFCVCILYWQVHMSMTKSQQLNATDTLQRQREVSPRDDVKWIVRKSSISSDEGI